MDHLRRDVHEEADEPERPHPARDGERTCGARNLCIARRFAQVRIGPLESNGRKTRRGNMADITFYTNPMSRGRIVHWLLEELGVPYDMKILDFEKGEHKSRRVLEDQSDGQSACDRASRHRRHRGRRDLHLSRRRLSESRPRAGARRSTARHLLALDLLRRGLHRTRDRRQAVQPAGRRAQRRARLRQLRRHVECARDGAEAGAVDSRATVSAPPTSTSARKSNGD